MKEITKEEVIDFCRRNEIAQFEFKKKHMAFISQVSNVPQELLHQFTQLEKVKAMDKIWKETGIDERDYWPNLQRLGL